VIEDLHWADPSTLELIGLLDEQGANSRVLLIQTARPEFLPPWPPRAHHTRITLSRLGRRHARSLVERLTGPARSSEPVTEALLERADGVPLFLEELVRVVVEEALDGVAPATIPSTERELPGELEADRALFTVVAQRESQLDVLECLRQRELDLPLARAGLAPTDEPSPGAKPAPRRCDGGSQSPTSAPANPVRR
jgi:hypothetical protein